jgi:hypothetical protein
MQNALNELQHDLRDFLLKENDFIEENQNQQPSVILDRPSTAINRPSNIETMGHPIIRINRTAPNQYTPNVNERRTSDSDQEENMRELLHQLYNCITSKEKIVTNQRTILLENVITVVQLTHHIRDQLTDMKDGIIGEHNTTKYLMEQYNNQLYVELTQLKNTVLKKQEENL